MSEKKGKKLRLKDKLRNLAKPLAAIIAIVMFYGAWEFVHINILNRPAREYVFTVNGEKVYKSDFQRELFFITQQSDQKLAQKKQILTQLGMDTKDVKGLPEDLLKEHLIRSFINRKVLASTAKNLKIKVSNGDVNKQIETIQNQIGGKDQFIQYITANGYNLKTFKEQLKSEMLIAKVQEKIQENSKPTEEELKKTYERFKYINFDGLSYENAKPQIEEILMNENSASVLNSYVTKEMAKAKIEFNDEEYKKLYENTLKVVVEKDGYKFTKADLNNRIIGIYFSNQLGYSEKLEQELIKLIENDLNNLIAIKNKAIEAGITANKDLVGLDELADYSRKYYNYLIDTYQPTEAEMKERFAKNKDMYNTQNTLEGYVVGQDFEPSPKDFAKLKSDAEELMKNLTKENFAENAKKHSKDPGSAMNGGKLGENTDITQFVPEFATAIKNAKAGEIVGPVKTDFGYHIIYVESKDEKNENIATASHILLTPEISEETKSLLFKKLDKLKMELDSKKVTWQQVNTQDKYNYPIKEQFKRLTKFDAIPGIGNDTELSQKLFAAKIGETIKHEAEFGAFLLTKVSEVPFKEAKFEDVKERIRLEFAIEHANQALGNLE